MVTWGITGFQDSASSSMEELCLLHDKSMVILVGVVSLVLMALSGGFFFSLNDRFFLQDHVVEVIWTLLPAAILVLLAAPSVQLLYLLDDFMSPSISLKAIGHQWYWSYEYSDFGGAEYDSYMVDSTSNRLMLVDNSAKVPVSSIIRVITTSTDVIHAWTVPSLGVKSDAVPGRLNQMSFLANRSGVYFGQCSEICGANHSFMPIKMDIMPMSEFLSKF